MFVSSYCFGSIVSLGSGSYSLFGALDKRNTIIISKLLDPVNTKDNSEAVRKAMILYDLCTNTSSIDARGQFVALCA